VTLVIGANGAGKTTSLRALSGFHRAKSGSVKLEDVELVGKSAHQVARRGMVLVPEGRKVFAPLTVEENLRMGGYLVPRREAQRTMEEVFAQFPILSDRSHQAAGLLSGGEQQMLAFGRALMARPRVMLLDEPSMGLAPTMVDNVMSSVRSMADRGIAVLMVEQNADAALPISDEVYVITRGETVWNGPADSADRAAMHAVLGESAMEGVDPAGERATADE
jgi:branched-chain amino acid transport system ATP-binding protein